MVASSGFYLQNRNVPAQRRGCFNRFSQHYMVSYVKFVDLAAALLMPLHPKKKWNEYFQGGDRDT